MIEISKEQFDELKKIEKHLRNAYYDKYVSGINNVDLSIAGIIWQQVYGKYERLNFACNSCVMNVFTKLGKLYFDNINKFNIEVEEKIIDSNEININSSEEISNISSSEEIEREEVETKKVKGRTTTRTTNNKKR